MSQLELAIAAGVHNYQISKLEWRNPRVVKKNGKVIVEDKYYCVSFRTVCLIARALDVSVSLLCSPDLF